MTFAAGRLGAPVKAVVPELIELLKKREPQSIQWRAARQRRVAMALGNFGTNAASAIPVLLELLNEQDDRLWREAAVALTNVGCEKRVLVAELVKKMDAAANDNLRFDTTKFILGIRSD